MNGIPFKCDRVSDDPAGIFYNRLQYDSEGKIIKYGPFTPQEISVALDSLSRLQGRQTS